MSVKYEIKYIPGPNRQICKQTTWFNSKTDRVTNVVLSFEPPEDELQIKRHERELLMKKLYTIMHVWTSLQKATRNTCNEEKELHKTFNSLVYKVLCLDKYMKWLQEMSKQTGEQTILYIMPD